MFFSRYKSFLIFVLVLLAVYQVSVLWFGFFYASDNNKLYADNQVYFDSIIKNMTVIDDEGKFYNIYNDFKNTGYKHLFDNTLKNTVENGYYMGTDEYESISLNKGSIIYNLGVDFPSSEISSVFKINKKFTKKINSFTRIEIIPDNNIPKNIQVKFVDTENKQAACFILENSDFISDFFDAATDIYSYDLPFFGVLDDTGINIIPDVNFYKYKPVKIINPVESKSGVLLMSLEKNVNFLFENPALKRISTVNDVYTYSDSSTVVKYYTNGVLEYSNYSMPTQTDEKINFYESYVSAVNFIMKDTEINNEYYLCSVEKDSGKIKFGFNYKINNFDVNLSDDYKESLGIDSFIEVTVSGRDVTKYVRLIYNIVSDEEDVIFFDTDEINDIKDILYIINENEEKGKLMCVTDSGEVIDCNEQPAGLAMLST